VPGVRRYKAVRAGVLADGTELRLVDRIAQFAGAARSTEHRRHGIQNALLAVRLADAATEGCDLAVIVTQPEVHVPPRTPSGGSTCSTPGSSWSGHPKSDRIRRETTALRRRRTGSCELRAGRQRRPLAIVRDSGIRRRHNIADGAGQGTHSHRGKGVPPADEVDGYRDEADADDGQ
jgi:hypothetical protein